MTNRRLALLIGTVHASVVCPGFVMLATPAEHALKRHLHSCVDGRKFPGTMAKDAVCASACRPQS
jgi:hypothetical protein